MGLSTPPQDKPPPVRELLLIAEHGEGWGVPADWEKLVWAAHVRVKQAGWGGRS